MLFVFLSKKSMICFCKTKTFNRNKTLWYLNVKPMLSSGSKNEEMYNELLYLLHFAAFRKHVEFV